jgi:hypothetical protein
MIVVEILLALAIALLLTGIFAYGFCELRGGDQLLFFFIILFLATWAGGVWVVRFGPLAYGISWLSFVIVGFLVALLLANLMSARKACQSLQASLSLFGVFFWLLTIILTLAIIVAYLFY